MIKHLFIVSYFGKLFEVLKTAAGCPQARQQFTDPFQLWRRTR